ncbi:hypothetical protein GCM10023149_49910 [Mucilaginibacter gynuensis]|uniref:Sialidase domain-containing protein n=2 Tax=Mucilaginibacter gynuensis TaxID=1302236 RepID=A0ABP8HH62_9SPHI
MASKPTFKNFKHYTLSASDDTTYMRSVSNTRTLKKVWIVYFDYEKDDWTVKQWIDSGKNNKVFGDTILMRNKKSNDNLGDKIDVYMAQSNDNGQSWESYDPNPAYLYCTGNPRLSNAVQLLVSNDFMNSNGMPSLSIFLQ